MKDKIYKHLKRGTTYKVLFHDVGFKCSHKEMDNTPVVIYQSLENGKIWARPMHEFYDPKRFEEITIEI